MNRVRVGQEWSCAHNTLFGVRVRFTIKEIDKAKDVCVVEFHDARRPGRRATKSMRILRYGLCAARIELQPNGRPPRRQAKPPRHFGQLCNGSAIERSKASDHVRREAPRGMTKAERARWEATGDLGETVE